MVLLAAMTATDHGRVSPHFQISNWGARDLDGRYSTDLRLILVFFFPVYMPSP